MRYVPEAERGAWQAKAVEAAAGAPLDVALKFLVQVDALERLVELVRSASDADLEDLSHYATEPVSGLLAPGIRRRRPASTALWACVS